jgi:hypothetical protein
MYSDGEADCQACDRGAWEGDFRIYGSDDIEELSGFTVVTGRLDISLTQLSTLRGLECLQRVDQLLTVAGNESLDTLDGLSGLVSVGGLHLLNNDSLTSLDGLDGITSIEDRLDIGGNDGLTSLDGLSGIINIQRVLFVTYNSVLPTCEATDLLGRLIGFDGFICIVGNLADTCPEDRTGCSAE